MSFITENAIVAVTPQGFIPTQRRMTLVLGQTGSGKTTFARHYLKDKYRVLIADAQFQEYGAIDFTPPDGAGFDALCDYLLKSDYQSSPAGLFRASYTPYESEYSDMCELARMFGPLDFVIEEADRFPSPAFCPEYEEIIARGRHYGVSICAISRHPYALPVSLRREANRIVVFRHQEPRDIQWLSEVIGPCAEKVPLLKKHEYFDWTPDAGELLPKKLNI